METKKLVLWLTSWRLILSMIVVAGTYVLPYTPTFAGVKTLMWLGPRWLTTWANFDGVHYLTIAEKGYVGTALIQAFFPLYPLILRYLHFWLTDWVWSGILISTLATFFGLSLLSKLIRLDWPQTAGYQVIWLLLTFPTAFFFTTVYSEGLFFLLVVSTFYCARTGKWWLAGIIGTLAASTRLVGVCLVPALVIEWWQSARHKGKYIFDYRFILACLPLIGLLAYMIYLDRTFHNPLLFYSVQSDFGAAREAGHLVLLPQVIWRYLKMLFTVNPFSWLYYRVVMELLAGVLSIVLIIICFRRLRPSYAVFTLLAVILPTLTGNLSSMPRYLLPLFPLFILLSRTLSGYRYWAVLAVFSIMQVINLLLFTQGVFVS